MIAVSLTLWFVGLLVTAQTYLRGRTYEDYQRPHDFRNYMLFCFFWPLTVPVWAVSRLVRRG